MDRNSNLSDYLGAHLATIKKVRHVFVGERQVPIVHGIGAQMGSGNLFSGPKPFTTNDSGNTATVNSNRPSVSTSMQSFGRMLFDRE